jgi:hypothetical protein
MPAGFEMGRTAELSARISAGLAHLAPVATSSDDDRRKRDHDCADEDHETVHGASISLVRHERAPRGTRRAEAKVPQGLGLLPPAVGVGAA